MTQRWTLGWRRLFGRAVALALALFGAYVVTFGAFVALLPCIGAGEECSSGSHLTRFLGALTGLAGMALIVASVVVWRRTGRSRSETPPS